jgi:hypothetical protein
MAERRPAGKPTSDIYTVLAAIALIALICGVFYVWYRQYQITDSFLPFGSSASAGPAVTEVLSTHHV